jgi:hypothetical protein
VDDTGGGSLSGTVDDGVFPGFVGFVLVSAGFFSVGLDVEALLPGTLFRETSLPVRKATVERLCQARFHPAVKMLGSAFQKPKPKESFSPIRMRQYRDHDQNRNRQLLK